MPRHQPFLFSLLTVLLLTNTSCKQSQKDKELIISMTKKLDEADRTNQNYTSSTIHELENETREWDSKERALEWFPTAEDVMAESKKIRNYILELRDQKKLMHRP